MIDALVIANILLLLLLVKLFPPGILIFLAVWTILLLWENKKTKTKSAPGPAAKKPAASSRTDRHVPEEEKAEALVPDPAEQKRLIGDLLAICYDEETGLFDTDAYERGLEEVKESLDDKGMADLRKKLKAIGTAQIYRLNNVLLKPAMHSAAIRQLPGALGMEAYRSMLDSIPFLFTGGRSRAGKGCPEKVSEYIRILRSIAAEERECTPEKLEEALKLTADL